MKQKLTDFLMVLACITITLLALWFMPCIGSAEQETEPAETELAASPCPDVVLMVAPEPTPTSEATLPPESENFTQEALTATYALGLSGLYALQVMGDLRREQEKTVPSGSNT